MANDKEKLINACPVDTTTRAPCLESQDSKISLPFTNNNENITYINHEKYHDSESECHSMTPSNSGSTLGSLWKKLTTWPAPPLECNNRRKENLGSNKQQEKSAMRLTLDREVSTIPRTQSPTSMLEADEGKCAKKGEIMAAANCEKESGVSAEGNWIYPSEKMFFDAMRRKGYSSEIRDMKTIVPIHNAVNEQAWKEIKAWEKPWRSEKCDGPKLHSFRGLSTSLTPKARLNILLGYMPPFDRHDWMVDRCGKRIEYVIDFYTGKDQGKGDGKLNFFLDVRPKLNSWEGIKMRAFKVLGFV